MTYLFSILAIGLILAAVNLWTRDRPAAYFLLACALLNTWAGFHTLNTHSNPNHLQSHEVNAAQ